MCIRWSLFQSLACSAGPSCQYLEQAEIPDFQNYTTISQEGQIGKTHINTLPYFPYLYLLSPVSLIDYVHLFSYTVVYLEVFPPRHPRTIILIPCTRSLTINNFKSPLIIFSSNENSGHSQFSL